MYVKYVTNIVILFSFFFFLNIKNMKIILKKIEEEIIYVRICILKKGGEGGKGGKGDMCVCV